MAKTLTRTAARIYGVLESLGDGSSDILDRLLPFFEPILAARAHERFDPHDVATDIQQTYKWNFSTDIVEVFVPRFREKGWLTPDDPDADITGYTVNAFSGDLQTIESTVRDTFDDIALDFKQFAESLSPLASIPTDVEEYKDILIEWLLYVEAFSEHNINFAVRYAKHNEGTLRSLADIPETTTLTDEQKFLCARYVDHAIENDPSSAEVLTRIASIGLLTEVVQDFIQPTAKVDRSDLVVYLDGPIAMDLLGVSGKRARANILPILSELQQIGAKVRIYQKSVEEVARSLHAVLNNPSATGPTAQAILRGDVIKEFVHEVAANPEAFLTKENVRVAHRTDDQFPAEIGYFPQEHRDGIYASLNFQQNPTAREHDSAVVSYVMQQRKGKMSRDLFRSKFILLTRNGLLSQLSRRKCIELGALRPNYVPPVVHRRVLATAVWLRTGLGEQGLEVPKRLLLASCEQVLAVRPGVVNAVRDLTEQLGDEERVRQLDLLISRDRSAQMLMDKTLGASSVVNKDNYAELLAEMLKPHLEEQRREHEQELEGERAKGEARDLEAATRIAATSEELREAQDELLAQKREDRDAIDALCEEVSTVLRRHKRYRVVGVMSVCVGICVTALVDPSTGWSYVGIPFAAVLAYLTLTGKRVIRTEVSQQSALAKLNVTAKGRNIEAKLERFEVSWNGNEFMVEDR